MAFLNSSLYHLPSLAAKLKTAKIVLYDLSSLEKYLDIDIILQFSRLIFQFPYCP